MKRRTRILLTTALLALPSTARAQTLPGFPPPQRAPADAPNILVIMTDDVGYAASSTFGGEIPTPTFDRLAVNGLRYSNFHVAALCSPTRAALLTGRNPHAVGFGSVADVAHGEPGYTSIIPKSAGTLGQIFSAAGYNTAFLGKHHNVPTWQSGPLGPFGQWPSGLGFSYFYGFQAGLTNQFAPMLIENNSSVDPPPQTDYIFDRDMADHAIDWLRMQRTQSGGKPFLLYYAPGTAHAPVQAPADWIARFHGKFDDGWDAYRTRTFARQKKLGIIPANARLAPSPPNIPAWNTLTVDQQRVYARHMEAYAAMLAYCDNQIGRVIEELRQSGRLDNTIVVYIQGDNGASGEGGENGSLNYAGRVSGTSNPTKEIAYALAHIDEIGGPRSYPIIPAGWAVAMNTPFPYYKVVASRLGGITDGMVVSWPAKIRQRGVRSQFVNVTDVLPTLLDAAGIAAPATLNATVQQPFDGVSFAQTFAQANAPSRHTTQYFEIMGHTAIYKDGWLAASRLIDKDPGNTRADIKAPWQLYDLEHDFSQTEDVAARYPARLAELQAAFRSEAERNHVLPLALDSLQVLLPQSRPEVTAAAGRYVFYPSRFRYSEGTFPSINNRSWSVDADIDVGGDGASGVLVTQGGRFSGWGLVVLKGLPNFFYRASDRDETLVRLAASRPLAAGHHHVVVRFTADGSGIACGGAYVMQVDGRIVDQAQVASTVPFKFTPEDAVIGRDSGTALTHDYAPPFPFDGILRSVTIELGPSGRTAARCAPAAG